MKILLTGKTGQIGWDLERIVPALGDVVALDRGGLDLADPNSIRRAVSEIRPTLIVNAAAYTAVDQAEDEPELAHAINAEGPGILAEEAKKIGAALIHYSTDYVFDGRKASPYIEDDPKGPLNVYGRTKLAGEEAIQAVGVPHLIFRTSWVYSTRGKNFLLTILRLAGEREELRVVNDQTGCPNWSRSLAEATAAVIKRVAVSASRLDFLDLSGIYHMSGTGQATWYQFALLILEKFRQANVEDRSKALKVRDVIPITTSEFRTSTQRPFYSLLGSSKLQEQFNVQLPDWKTQLEAAMNAIAREIAVPNI
jgi:dTDP-4-dehydrorhamnose reductase